MYRIAVGLIICALGIVPALGQTHSHDAKTTPKKSGSSKQKTQQVYSCPMHPDVTSKAKGRCPKCGMDLRPTAQKATSSVVENSVSPNSNKSGELASDSNPDGMRIPDVEVLDQDGRKLHFYSDLVKGQTVAINFIFTTCTTICPPLGATFARVQKELGDKVGRDVHFISISVDPATDTPERLKAWGAKFHAGEGWTFVTGNKQQVDELLSALGASAASREDHSPTVLIGNDAHNNWTRTYGLAKSSQLVQIINETLAGKSPTATVEVSKQ